MILGFVSSGYLPYWPVPLLIGPTAGIFANAGWFKHLWKVVIVGISISMVAAITSSLIAARIFGEYSISPSYFLVEEPLDKVNTTLIVFGIAQLLPKRFLALLPRSENIGTNKRETKPQTRCCSFQI